ncbi:MAG TPA: tail fiber protein [Gemmataceae bacterium]|nr:tail fiber protein [Gemmataceae bacterium]
MSQPFVGEIRMVGFNFPPRGNALCNGQLLAINQNQALFSLLGTTYGGNGTTNFALPNLQGSTPIHGGPSFNLGQTGGEANHTLAAQEMPQHTHTAQAAATAGAASPGGNFWGGLASGTVFPYSNAAADTTLEGPAVGPTGGSQAHNNLQPYLVINFIIALVGIFPSRN